MTNNKENELDKQDSAEVKNYTRTPNMLIFGYQDISPQEKWLYVCFKHMCGKRGTRHLSLRYISEQTGISVGALSKSKDKKGNINEGMIKHLHDAGLIHSEIKKLNGKGNPLYHITITDVWGLNQAFFTRPNSEQDENEENEPVRNSDEPVRNSDKLARNSDKPVRISDEPVRKPLQYQDYIQDYKQDDNNTREQEREIPLNTLDTTPVVSSDTAHASLPSKDEQLFTNDAPKRKSILAVRLADGTETLGQVERYEGKDSIRVIWLEPQGQYVQAWSNGYGQKHFPYESSLPVPPDPNHTNHGFQAFGEYRILSKDEAASLAIIPLYRRIDQPQGDDHATAASRHPRRVGDAAAPGGATHHSTVDNGQVATPETGPVLEAQEVAEKGQTDDTQPNHPGDIPAGNTLVRHLSNPAVRGAGDTGREQRERAGTPARNVATGNHPAEAQTQIATTPTPAQSPPLPQTEQAVSGARARTRKPAEPKPETRSSPPVEPPSDMAWGTKKCLMWFDFWRGGILIGKWKLMQASTCAKGLAEQFDEQTVIQARTDMEADPYYAAKGGCDVCDVANNIHKYLKRRCNKQKPAIVTQSTLKVVKRYSSYDDPNFSSEQDFYPVEGGSYAAASR